MKGILLVSNFLFEKGKGSRMVCEELAGKLAEEGRTVIKTSNKVARVSRLYDMLHTTWARRRDYDMAHVAVFSGPAFLWAESTCELLKRLKKPFALTLHGGNLPQFARKHPARVRRLMRSARVVVAPSEFLKEQMKPYAPWIKVIPNAVDLSHYLFRERTFASPSLIWVRAFDRIYNPMLAPRVLRLVADDFPGVRLTMVGPDKDDGSFQETVRVARELGVEQRIRFAGGIPKEDIPLWLHCGDIFLNTTNVDNTPVSVIEAMACGLCVVSTGVGGIPHLITDGRDGLLVPPDNPAAMAQAIRRVLCNPVVARTLSSDARAKVESFDWSVILPKWRAVFRLLEE